MEKQVKVEVGYMYETKDGRKAFVFRHNSVNNEYEAVILNTNEFMSIHEDGKYFETRDSHNDFVKVIK